MSGKSKKRKPAGMAITSWDFMLHTWESPESELFYTLSRISKRNWMVLMRYHGLVDGKKWTMREIAEKEGLAPSRVCIIINSATDKLEKFLLKRGLWVDE